MIKKSIIGLAVCLCLVAASNAWAQTNFVLDTWDPAERICNPKSYTDLGNGVVRDNVTGLEWQQATAPVQADLTYQEALDYVAGMNAGSNENHGYTDWRMPTIEELATLADTGRWYPDPAIHPIFFSVPGGYFYYWSSSQNSDYSEGVWVQYQNGAIFGEYKSNDGALRAVRSGYDRSTDNFIINGDGTVTDPNTGLMWQQCNYGQTSPGAQCTGPAELITWDEAVVYIQELNNTVYLGYDDWRLPTKNELQSLLDYSLREPATRFPSTISYMYWSSTARTGEYQEDDRWYVEFQSGWVEMTLRDDDCFVRAVRSGPCWSGGDWCIDDSDCSDGDFCNGEEVCDNATCVSGTSPCSEEEYCDEVNDLCAECLSDGDCADDNLYCTGEPQCVDGLCGFTGDPCDNSTSVCDEAVGQCVECVIDSDCEPLNSCEDNICIPLPTSSPLVEVSLQGPGFLHVFFDPNGIDIALIALLGTTEDSSLTIKSKSKGFPVYLDELEIDGSLKAVKGKGIILAGPLTATGGIGTMQLDGVDPESSIDAAWIGNLSVKGDFFGNVSLTGAGFPPKGLTLGKLSIKGTLDSSVLIVDGNVGSVKAGTWGAGSTLAVGVDPGEDGLFFTDDDMTTGGSLGKIKYKSYDTDNGGHAFGIIADNFTKPDTKVILPFDDGDFRIWEN